MVRDFPFATIPTGWFQAAWSIGVKPGEVVSLDALGEDLIVYRGENGAAYVMDAFCPHLGAHLAYGGLVQGENLTCPFHGWVWGPDGVNVEIPYSKRTNLSRRLRVWDVAEVDGIIWVWHDSDGKPPTWRVPKIADCIDGFDESEYLPVFVHTEDVGFPPQLVAENACDMAHLRYVHRWAEVPSLDKLHIEGPWLHTELLGRVETKNGPTKVKSINDWWGLGYSLNQLLGLRDTVEVLAFTPTSPSTSRANISIWVSQSGPEQLSPESIVKAQINEILGNKGDRRIWEHQKYIAAPPLAREEAKPFMDGRRWAWQFYNEASPG